MHMWKDISTTTRWFVRPQCLSRANSTVCFRSSSSSMCWMISVTSSSLGSKLNNCVSHEKLVISKPTQVVQNPNLRLSQLGTPGSSGSKFTSLI